MSVATMMATLKLNITDFASKLDTADNRLNKFREKANKVSDTLKSSGGKMSNWAKQTSEDYKAATSALNKHNLGLKDTARIVQGIIISQVFYTTANAISNATSALWNFNKELDYAKITYSALFGSTDLASKFSTVLQEHTVETIFDYQQLSAVSKKLLAYGIEYKNLMFVMEGMTNLGAMSGDAQAMDRIGLALGQIKTTGYLTATEMRQLANAYVPIYDIVQEAFGLTGEQMQKVGDLKLPAHDVINAIVDYANEKFGAVGDAATMTITGLENRIVDTLKVVGSAMIEPITTAYKSLLVYLTSGLEGLRDAYDSGGLGGVFEFLVPDEGMQTTIRQFIANVRNLLMSLASVLTVVANLFGNFAQVIVTAFNIVAPVVANVVNVLSAMLNAILQTNWAASVLRVALVAAAGAFVVLRVQAAAALVITAVTKAVTVLSGALVTLASIISKHPIISLLFALGVSLVGVSVASGKANKAISGVADTLSGIGGVSSKDVLQPVKTGLKDSANAADEFNKRLEEGTGAAKDLTDAIGGTGKAAKKAKDAVGLLSFDEVFKLPEQANASGGAGGGGVGTGLVSALEGLGDVFGGLSDSLIPDIPDFSEYLSAFTDGLFGGLDESIVEKLKSMGIGGLIGGTLGAIIGGIIGGPAGATLGAKIGAFAGGVVGLIWDALDGAMSNTFGGLGAGILGAIGKALSGAGAAGLGSILKNAFANGGFKGMWAALGGVLKTTGAKAILKGGAIGAAVGLVVDGIAHLLWNWMAESIEGADAETAKVGQTIGSVLGTVIGAIIGGPAGALIGSAIGTFAGGLVGLFWDPIAEYFNPEDNALSAFFVRQAERIAEWASGTWSSLSNWIVDTATGFANWATDTWGGFSKWLSKSTSGFTEWFSNTFSGFSTWLEDTISIFSDWDSINSETLSNWISDTTSKFGSWVSETFSSLKNWFTDTVGKFRAWKSDTILQLAQWAIDAIGAILKWISDTRSAFNSWKTDLIKIVIDWVKGIVEKINTLHTSISTTLAGIAIAIGKWFKDLPMIKWLDDHIMQPIKDFFNLNNFWSKISSLLSKIKEKFSNWWSGLFDKDVKVSGSVTGSGSNASVSLRGHATGGVFNREHIARFAEGNRAEAIIPLENRNAMQPFVDAVSNGLVSSLAPIVANINAGSSSNLPPLYVGTLIADDRGIKQLYDKFEVIRLQESDRRGTTFA